MINKISSLLMAQGTIASVSLIFRRKDDGLTCSLVPTMEKVATKQGATPKEKKIRSFVFAGSPEEVEAGMTKALEEQLVASLEQSDAVLEAQENAKKAIAAANKEEEAAKKRTKAAKKEGKSVDSVELDKLKKQVEALEVANAAKDSVIEGLRKPLLFTEEV